MTFRPLDILLDYAASPDADVRANAAAALGEMSDPEAQRSVVELLGDPDRRVREAAFASHLGHPAPAGFLPRFTAARRLRTHSADLVGRRAVGPSIAGIGFAVVFALAAYLLLTGLVSRELESAVWDSLIFAAITAGIGAAFAIVAATSARPIAHYRDLLSGLAVELAWTFVVGILPAVAMGTLIAVSIMPAQDTGVVLEAVEEQVKSAGFIWHLSFVSGAILVTMLAARLAAALAARSLAAGGIRAIASGVGAFMLGWFALWLLLLPWQAGARVGEFDVGIVGRIGLGAFVGLGAYAATLGYVESAGARRRLGLSQRWMMRAAALSLAMPGLFSVAHLAVSLPSGPRVINVDELTSTARISAPQMIHFNLPLDAEVLLEVSPSSLDEKDRETRSSRNLYGKPFADRETIKKILQGTASISDFTSQLYQTEKGYDFWINEFYTSPEFSSEARKILEYWARHAPRTMPVIDAYAPSSPDYPPPPPSDPAAAPVADPSAISSETTRATMPKQGLAKVPAWLVADALHRTGWGQQTLLPLNAKGNGQGILPTGRLEVCVRDDETGAACDTNETFEALFAALGERAVESWPLIGRPRPQGEVRLTVLTDVDADLFRLATIAVTALRHAARTNIENQDTLLVAVSSVSLSSGCDAAIDLKPGDVILHKVVAAKSAEAVARGPISSETPQAPEKSSSWLIKQGGTRTYDDFGCAAPSTGRVVEIPVGDEGSTMAHISAALQLGVVSGSTPEDDALREPLARLIASGLAALRKEQSPPDSSYRLMLASSAQIVLNKANDVTSPPIEALTCQQDDVEFLVAGSAVAASKTLLDRAVLLSAGSLGDMTVNLGPKWNTAWQEVMLARKGSDWVEASDAKACGAIEVPPELTYGPLPANFRISQARDFMAGDREMILEAFDYNDTPGGVDYWADRYEEMGNGLPLREDARKMIEYWITLAEAQLARLEKEAGAIDFGNDSGEFARDGECDDPRFSTAGISSHRLADATDCRAAWESGHAEYTGD